MRSSRTFNLSDGAHAKGAIEKLTLIGSGNIDGTGNGLGNQITGNSRANTLSGLGGNDTIFGGAANDVLIGGNGNDVLTGGRGQDDQNGGAGADRVDFNSIAETPDGGGRDIINGFSRTQNDRIDLASIDADQRAANPGNDGFRFIGSQSFAAYHADHPAVFGMVRFAGGVLQGNVNSNLGADFEIGVGGVSSLIGTDLVL